MESNLEAAAAASCMKPSLCLLSSALSIGMRFRTFQPLAKCLPMAPFPTDLIFNADRPVPLSPHEKQQEKL